MKKRSREGKKKHETDGKDTRKEKEEEENKEEMIITQARRNHQDLSGDRQIQKTTVRSD